jgi:hypothetical protein
MGESNRWYLDMSWNVSWDMSWNVSANLMYLCMGSGFLSV